MAAVAVGSLLVASAGQSALRVIGGSSVQVQAAPWSVVIKQTVATGSLLCGGSILDAALVLTAAHCVYDQNGQRAPASALSIRAGISNYTTPLASDAEQARGVVLVRVHPGYVWSRGASPDDVAVLAVSSPFDLSGPAVAGVTLPVAGLPYPSGSAIGIAGYGREGANASPDGSLNWLTGTVDAQGECGGFSNTVVPGDDAVAFCAASPGGSICSGDSGSALVRTDSPRTIVGIASAGPTSCGAGSHGVFTYVGAAEILRFIQGDDHPPTAPRQTTSTYVTLTGDPPVRAGQVLKCDSGGWDGSPVLAYAFVGVRTGQTYQQGPRNSFTIPVGAVGDRVYCRAFATNDGGTGTLATTPSGVIGAVPRLGIERLAPIAAVRGVTVRVTVVLEAARGVTGRFGVCITPPAAVAARGCASARVDDGGVGGYPLTVRLRIRQTAPAGTSRVQIAATAGLSKAQSAALVRVGR